MSPAIALLLCAAGDPAAAQPAPEPKVIPINRQWDVLKGVRTNRLRKGFRQAGEALGDWEIQLAGTPINGATLKALADTELTDPFTRVVREGLRRPIDVLDFLYFIDDVLRAGEDGLRGQQVFVTGGRARKAGVMLHPDDIFKGKPRIYGEATAELNIDKPLEPEDLPPAANGDILGPNWSARFENPDEEEDRMATLVEANPSYAERHAKLIEQLRAQGAEVYVTSTVRLRERGYLMYGAFMLSRTKNETQLEQGIEKLERFNEEWELNVPIKWRHPDGWQATIEAARNMSDAYDVVYATERGAKTSNHYGGVGVDLVALALPRSITLEAPNGKRKVFNLAGANQPRDLSLTPEMIRWIERHFQMKKLLGDYPHWNDAAPRAKVTAK